MTYHPTASGHDKQSKHQAHIQHHHQQQQQHHHDPASTSTSYLHLILCLLISFLWFSSLLLVSSAENLFVRNVQSSLRRHFKLDTVIAAADFDFAGPPIPPNFASFSIEPYAVFDWTDRVPQPTNPAFVSLMKQLNPTIDSPGPVIRIGGNSADMAFYNPSHGKRPEMPYGPGLWYDITDNDILSLGQLAESIHGKLVLGVNFRVPENASLAIEYLSAVERLIGWKYIAGIEIGNEPDVFEWTQLRAHNYSLNDYTREFLTYAKQLHDALPLLPEPIIQGGAFGGLNWVSSWHRFFSRARNYLKSVSYHYYPLSLCQGGTPTIHRLLSDYASQGAARALLKGKALAMSRDYGLPLVVSEGGSVSCGRMPGVSNSYAAALWAIDQMFVDSSVGINSWHFHYSGGNTTLTYSPLVKQSRDKAGLTVMPIYYGLRFFALATMNHSTIYRVNISETSNSHIKVYAMLSINGIVQIAVLHKDAGTHNEAVISLNITLPDSFFSTRPSASVLRLNGPSANSVSGITLGGLSYDESIDGEASGLADEEWLTADHHGIYQLRLSALSAVLLTLNPDGPYHRIDSTEGAAAIGVGNVDVQMNPLTDDQRMKTKMSQMADGADDVTLSDTRELSGLAGLSAPRDAASPLIPAVSSFDNSHASDVRETWKSRRGKFALTDAKSNYEQQIQTQVEKITSQQH